MEGNTISKKLSTWLPLDVHRGLTEFAKVHALTGLDKFDYGTAIRILLMKSEMCDRWFELKDKIDELESKIDKKPEEVLPEGVKRVHTFADKSKSKKEEQNGKI